MLTFASGVYVSFFFIPVKVGMPIKFLIPSNF